MSTFKDEEVARKFLDKLHEAIAKAQSQLQ